MSIDERALPFVEDDKDLQNKGNKSSDKVKEENLTAEQKQELKELNEWKEHKKKLRKQIEEAKYISLPDDPHYRPISEELLEVNEINPATINTVTRIMINVALSDYAIVRKIDKDSGEAKPMKLEFKHVNYDEYLKYQEAQENIDYANNMISMIQTKENYTVDDLKEIRTIQQEIRTYIDAKLKIGLEVFFKKSNVYNVDNRKEYQYNDMLFAIETGFYKYIKSPFLRQISSINSS